MTDAPDRLLAGAAAYNVAEFRVAEQVWSAEQGLLCSGLAALADAVASGRAGEWATATTAAERARELLADADPAVVSRPPLGRWLDSFLADPESVERGRPPAVMIDGKRRVPGTLPLRAAGLAAEALATASEYDEGLISDAIRFAGEESQPEQSTYATFLRDFVGNPDRRPVVYERLSGLVERDRRKERDVSGLFDKK
jgi:hypothetical protein